MFVRKKRRSRRGPAKKPRSRKSARPHLPAGLEQRHVELFGLFLIAAGVYLSFVLFFGWEGGKVGYGVETGLEYLVGKVGARIATVLMLVVGGVLVSGTSISSIFRGLGRGVRHVVLGGRGVAETAIQHREERRRERTLSDFETRAAATDVMSAYPDEDHLNPTVAMGEDDLADPYATDHDPHEGSATTSEFPPVPGSGAEDAAA